MPNKYVKFNHYKHKKSEWVTYGIIKEAYSNLCMKIHLTSKLTQYLTNIFKMRFLMRNCIKYANQCQNRIFEKTCQATTVP